MTKLSRLVATYEYITVDFDCYSPSGKTSIWTIRNTKTGSALGNISWNGQWRQYVLHPFTWTIFSAGCLRDVAEFIKEKNREHKEGTDARPN